MRCGVSRNSGVYMSVGVTRPQDRDRYTVFCVGVSRAVDEYMRVGSSPALEVYMRCGVSKGGAKDIKMVRQNRDAAGAEASAEGTIIEAP